MLSQVFTLVGNARAGEPLIVADYLWDRPTAGTGSIANGLPGDGRHRRLHALPLLAARSGAYPRVKQHLQTKLTPG